LTRVLLIKTSSLGDVIHCLPAVSDMAHALPQLELDWLIEAPLAEIAGLHPAVSRIIPTRQRAWRKAPLAAETRREFGAMRSAIAQGRYDRVIDAQGLIRTAALSRFAPGPHCGYDVGSVREPPASLFYDRRFKVSVTLHAVERMRSLCAQALGYPLPSELDYGVRVDGERPAWLPAGPYLVGLHATARADKAWAEEAWIELGRRAARRGVALVAPWGDDAERARAERITAKAAGAVAPPPLSFRELAALFAGAVAVAGVDTGLTHLASAVGAPVVAIYAASWSEFNGVMGPAFVANLGGPGDPPGVDEVWEALEGAIQSGPRTGAWRSAPAEPAPDLSGRRRFRPSNARAVVHRR
jgi:heptosyltransferase-1